MEPPARATFSFTGMASGLPASRNRSPIRPLTKLANLQSTLSKSSSKSWANWSVEEAGKLDMKFTIRMSDNMMLYSKESMPVKQFEQTMKHMDDIQGMRKRASETAANMIVQSIEEDTILVIFGSNHI